jgi:hypothetical protein
MEDLEIGGRILKWVLKKWTEGVDWINLALDGDQRRALVNILMNMGFNERRGISWIDERLLGSQEVSPRS